MATSQYVDRFNDIINTMCLREIFIEGGLYTWSNNQSHPTLEKLDRILMSNGWEDLFPLVIVRKLVRDLSDHNSLLLSTNSNHPQNPKPREFRFEMSWMTKEEFLPLVSKIWQRPVKSSNPIDVLNIKLKRFKKFFKGWGADKFGHDRKEKEKIKNELADIETMEEQGNLDPETLDRRAELCGKLQQMLADEELFWLQQSHETWLLKGDQNTSFFHRIANGRKRKNTFHSFSNGDETIEGTENLLKHATDYYRELFGTAPGNLFHMDPGSWGEDEKLTDTDNDFLTRPFSEEEVKAALFSMDSNRAPGPDNIPAEFYRFCWEIVKQDIMNLFVAFHEGTLDVERLNYGIITLIPKISGAKKIQEFRPICLLRCPYKLITKVLDNRVAVFADKLISRHQNAFYQKA